MSTKQVSHVTSTTLIPWQRVLEIAAQTDLKGFPVPFSVTFCTADQQKGTGGEIIAYERAVSLMAGSRRTAGSARPAEVLPGTNPNHKKHATLNIRGVDSDQIRKVHLHLILTINGLSVR